MTVKYRVDMSESNDSDVDMLGTDIFFTPAVKDRKRKMSPTGTSPPAEQGTQKVLERYDEIMSATHQVMNDMAKAAKVPQKWIKSLEHQLDESTVQVRFLAAENAK